MGSLYRFYLQSVCRVVSVPPVSSSTSFEPVYPAEPSRTSTNPGERAQSPTTTAAAPGSTGDVQTVSASNSWSPLPVVTDGGFCEAKFMREVEWPRTPAGSTVVVECPNNRNSQCASSYCTPPPQLFYGPFSGTTRASRCQKRTSGLYDARKD